MPVSVTESDMTAPEESQRAGPTQVQSKPVMLDGKSVVILITICFPIE